MGVKYYKLKIKGYLPEEDFLKILARCDIQEDGKKYKLYGDKTKEIWVNPAHIKGVKMILSRLGITPQIEVVEDAKAKVEIETEGREDMPTTIKIFEEGIKVVDSRGKEVFVPARNIDVVWKILKSEKRIMPRRLWAKLAEAHKLFPELDEAVKIIRNADIEQAKKDLILNALYEYRASAFEGKRTKKKGQEDLNYYVLYWYPILVLKRLELIEQKGAKEIYLTGKGEKYDEWSDAVKDFEG